MRNFMLIRYAIILGTCAFSVSALGDQSKAVVKKSPQKISSEFLEFFDEFSDDEDSVVQLLVEDKEGNIMIGGAADGEANSSADKNSAMQRSETFRKRRFNQSTSSLSSSGVVGVKP